ncbi:ABC transporter permease [Longispora sp. K20-0274]|uniref:ABC transporter permease n=1 Tax=Longispora sp. K20-0274 TaxID=3088255 RepID=UPI00399C3B6F
MNTLMASARRSGAMIERNIAVYRRIPWTILSGFLEPVFYLFSLGIGVGALVKATFEVNGSPMSYALFVAPAMMANAAFVGAVTESVFNFFGKMKFARLYDAVLATPVQPLEIAAGELTFALARGGLYSAAFLALMSAMGLVSSWWALAALPAALLVGMAAGGLGLAVSTFLRGWQDFDYVGGMLGVLFLFSGTFAPLELYPTWAQWLIQATPLYHGVELIRGLTTGNVHPGLLVHVAYLLALGSAGLWVASRRMTKLLLR